MLFVAPTTVGDDVTVAPDGEQHCAKFVLPNVVLRKVAPQPIFAVRFSTCVCVAREPLLYVYLKICVCVLMLLWL